MFLIVIEHFIANMLLKLSAYNRQTECLISLDMGINDVIIPVSYSRQTVKSNQPVD